MQSLSPSGAVQELHSGSVRGSSIAMTLLAVVQGGLATVQASYVPCHCRDRYPPATFMADSLEYTACEIEAAVASAV